jgi:outer membrane protein assembly factor BamB
MSDEERLADLLLSWEERFQQGDDLPADELCQGWPELVEPLAERIASLKRMAWVIKKGQIEKGNRIRLRGHNGDIDGKIWESETVFQAGRMAALEIALDDNSVSRRHAEFCPTPNGWQLKDLGSTNGTFINGTRLGAGEYTVRTHDIVRFGNVRFVVEFVELSHCKRLWQAKIPDNRPLATPAIANNTVLIGGGFGSHHFSGFAADTGKLLWNYQTKDDGPTAAVALDGLFAFHTESCELEVLTVEGKPVWKKWLGDPLMSMPAAANGRLFSVYPDSQGDGRYFLACFQMQTGDMLWRKPVSADAITAPVLAEENVYLTTQDGAIWCFRQSDGEKIWTKDRNATSAPTIWNKTCFYSRRQEGYRPDNETVQWECLGTSHTDLACQDFERTWCKADYLDYGKRKTHSDVEMMSQTLDGTVGFSNAKGHSSIEMSRANLGQGTVAGAWSYQGSRPCVYRNRLYSCVGRHVQCLDPLSGDIGWKTRVAEGDQPLLDLLLTPPVTVNGKIIVATATGDIVCLCSETGKGLWRENVGEPIRFQPAVAFGRVYVATATGSLYCLETGDERDHGWLMWGGTAAHNGIAESPVFLPAASSDSGNSKTDHDAIAAEAPATTK